MGLSYSLVLPISHYSWLKLAHEPRFLSMLWRFRFAPGLAMSIPSFSFIFILITKHGWMLGLLDSVLQRWVQVAACLYCFTRV